MIPDKFFTWQWAQSLQPCIDYLAPIFKAAPELAKYERDTQAGKLSEHCALVLRHFRQGPGWLVVSLQREQSLLTRDFGTDAAGREKALQAATGFVGQDVGRSTLPGYYGLYNQVFRCVEQTAWLFGKISSNCWDEDLRTVKTTTRWRPGVKLKVQMVPGAYGADKGRWEDYTPLTGGEYLQLAYTPHKEVLETNEKIAKKYAGQFF